MAHKQQTNNKQRTNKAGITTLSDWQANAGLLTHCVGTHHNDSTEIIVTASVSLPRFPSAVIGALISSASEAGPAGPRHQALDEPSREINQETEHYVTIHSLRPARTWLPIGPYPAGQSQASTAFESRLLYRTFIRQIIAHGGQECY